MGKEMSKADCDVLSGVREILARLRSLELGMETLGERLDRLEVDHADTYGEWTVTPVPEFTGPTYETVIVEGPIVTEGMTPAEMAGVHKYLAARYGISLQDTEAEP